MCSHSWGEGGAEGLDWQAHEDPCAVGEGVALQGSALIEEGEMHARQAGSINPLYGFLSSPGLEKKMAHLHVYRSNPGWGYDKDGGEGSTGGCSQHPSNLISKLTTKAAHDPGKLLLPAKVRCQKVFIQFPVQLFMPPSPSAGCNWDEFLWQLQESLLMNF